jgi:hypothetical protein
VEAVIGHRARVVAGSSRQRRAFATRARDVIEELATSGGGGAPPAHVVDAALAVASDARVLVLLAPDDDAADVTGDASAHVEWLGTALGRLGLTVVVLASRVRVAQPVSASQQVPASTEEEWS